MGDCCVDNEYPTDCGAGLECHRDSLSLKTHVHDYQAHGRSSCEPADQGFGCKGEMGGADYKAYSADAIPAQAHEFPCESKTTQPSRISVQESKASTSQATTPDHHIRFGSVHVRLYVSGLGDNPSVSSGVPVGLTDDWEDAEAVTIERHVQCKPIRPYMFVPYLSQEQRLDRCLKTGSSPEEIQKTMLEVRTVQEHRMQSLPLISAVDTFDSFTFEDSLNELYNSFTDKSRSLLNSWGNKLRQLVEDPEQDDARSSAREGEGGGDGGGRSCTANGQSRSERRSAHQARSGTGGFADGLIAWLEPMAQGFGPPSQRREVVGDKSGAHRR